MFYRLRSLVLFSSMVVVVFLIVNPSSSLAAGPVEVMYDEQTGLDICLGPNENVSWSDAKSWIRDNFPIGEGWRLPSQFELRKLFRLKHINEKLVRVYGTSGWYLWSRDSSATAGSMWGKDRAGCVGPGRDGWCEIEESSGRAMAVRPRAQ